MIIVKCCIFVLFIISLIFKLINVYFIKNYNRRLPEWFDKTLNKLFYKKILKNYKSNNLFNNFIRLCYYKFSFMNWGIIEVRLNELSDKIIFDNFKPDICVGVLSGGAFYIKYLSEKLSCENNFYLKCKVWSDTTLFNQFKSILNRFVNYEQYLNDNKTCDITEINGLSEYMKNNIVKNVLLFDDSVSTGKTIYATANYLKNKYPNINLKIATLTITNNKVKKLVNYYFIKSYATSIIRESGAETD